MNNKVFEKDIKIDIMRYKANQSSFLLCILAIVLNVAMFLIVYKETNCVPSYLLGIDLIINVVFMLAAFLIAEKTKAPRSGCRHTSPLSLWSSVPNP